MSIQLIPASNKRRIRARRVERGQAIENGMEPLGVAAIVLDAIRANRVHIFTHRKTEAMTKARFDGIMGAFDALKS